MTVNQNAAKAGKRYETELMNYLRNQAFDVERLRLTGAQDEGDLLLRIDGDRFIMEAKRQRSLNLAGWVKEAKIESANYRAHRDLIEPVGFVVVHHARGKSISESYVTTTLAEWLERL